MAYPNKDNHTVPPIPKGYEQVEETSSEVPPLPDGYEKKNPVGNASLTTSSPTPSVSNWSRRKGNEEEKSATGSAIIKQQGFDTNVNFSSRKQRHKVEQQPDGQMMFSTEPRTISKKGNLAEHLEVSRKNQDNRLGHIYNGLLDGVESLGAGALDLAVGGILSEMQQKGLTVDGKPPAQAYNEWRQYKEESRGTLKKMAGADVTPEQEKKYNEEAVTSALNGLANFAPAMAGGLTPMIIQGYDSGLQSINSTEEGKNLPESTKTAFGAATGAAFGILQDFGLGKIFGKQTDKLALKLTTNAISKLAKEGVPITTEMLEKTLAAEAGNLKNKIVNAGSKVAQATLIQSAIGGGMDAVNQGLEKVVNEATGKKVFDEQSWTDRLLRIGAATKHGAVSGVILGGVSLPFSKSRNYIKEKVSEAESPTDITNLKSEITEQVNNGKMSKEEADQAYGMVDLYAQVNSKIPKGTPNRAEIADDIISQEELKAEIAQKENDLGTIHPALQADAQKEITALKNQLEIVDDGIAKKAATPDKEYIINGEPVTEDVFLSSLNSKKVADYEYNGEDATIIKKLKDVGGKSETTTTEETILEPIELSTETTTPKEQTPTVSSEGVKEKTFSSHALDRAEAKKIYAKAREVDVIPDADQIALDYIANGGKVGESAINEVAGTVKRARLNTGERENKSSEAKARDYYDKNGGSLDEIAHDLWEKHGQEVSERDIKDALIDAIGSHNTRLSAAKTYLERYSAEYAEEKQREQFIREHEEEVAAEEKAINDWLSGESELEIEAMNDENYVTNLIKKYETESKGEDKQSSTGTESQTDKGISGKASPNKTEQAETIKPQENAIQEQSKEQVSELIKNAAVGKKGERAKQLAMEEEAAKHGELGKEVLRDLGGEKPPPEIPVINTDGDSSGKLNDKGILSHLTKAGNVPEVSKKGFEEKGLKYKTASQKEAELVAKSVIDKYGVNDAVLLAQAEKFDGDVNSIIYAESLNRLARAEQEAKTPTEKLAFAKQFAEVGIKYDESARSKGRFNAAINYFYKKSPLGIKLIEEAKRQQEFSDFSKKKDQSWKDFFDEMVKEPEFEKIFKENVREEMKKERAAARVARKAKVDDIINKAKDTFKGGAAYSTIIPPKVITVALEGIRKGYHAGEKVAEIIQDAIDYISTEIGDAWDKEKFRKEWEGKLGKDPESKKTPEEISAEAKQKILDKFRNKLKGLNEKQKDEVIRKAFKRLVENGALEYSDFKKIIGETLGYGELTPEQAKKLTELVNDINSVDELAKKVREDDRSVEALNKYKDAQKKAEKSATELGKLVFNKPDISKRLLSVMQLNTLGIPSLINNPIFNVFNQATVRFPKSLIMTGIDYGIYGVGKLFGKDYKPENNIFHAQLEFYKKLGYGSKQSVEQLFTGLTNKDYFQKEVYAAQIHPFTSMKELWDYSQGKINLTKEQRVDKAIQATVGIPAEAIARVLNIGDKPQRFASEGAQAATFAKNLGLQGIDYKLFMEFPKEEAYRKLRKDGMGEEAAMKKAEEIQERIIKEGEESTFQQDNLLNDAITAAFKPFGKAGEAFKTLNMPFVKIPLNAFWSVYNLANPEVALLQSAIYGAKAIRSKSKSDIQESKKWFAHAVTGMMLMGGVGILAKNGIINSPNPDDTTKKEREGENYYEQQNSVNISKLMAFMKGDNPNEVKNGLNIDLKWLGNVGIVMGYQQQKLDKMTPKQKEKGLGYMEDMLSNLQLSALDFMDKGVFSNTGSLFTAVNKGGSFMDNYLLNVMNMGTNIVQPAMFAQISRAQLPYYSKVKADNFIDEIKNNMLTRSSTLRNLSGKYPPSKIGIWGDVLDKKDNTAMRLFGISRANDDNFAQPLYNDYKRTHNTKFFPSAVKPEIRDNGVTVKLSAKDAAELEQLVGQERKKLVAPYVNNMAKFEGSNKTYSQLKTDEEKTDKLEILYNEGFKNGKYLFLLTHPQYKVPADTKKQETEEKKLSKENEKLRDALKKKSPIKK